jgi:hypothetical protein
VTDCSISTNTAGGSGIRMASNSRVDGLTITNTSFTGNNIGLYQANDGNTTRLSNLLVDECVFSGNTFAAIYMEEVRDASIEDSLFTSNGYGILLFKNYTGSGVAVSNLAIRRNTMSGHTNPALELESIARAQTPSSPRASPPRTTWACWRRTRGYRHRAVGDVHARAGGAHEQLHPLTGAFTTRTAAYGVLVRGNGPVVLTGNTPTGRRRRQRHHAAHVGRLRAVAALVVRQIPATASITGVQPHHGFRNGISVWTRRQRTAGSSPARRSRSTAARSPATRTRAS